jgi:murein endopeptidase
MRLLVVALALSVAVPATAEARPKRPAKTSTKKSKQVATEDRDRDADDDRDDDDDSDADTGGAEPEAASDDADADADADADDADDDDRATRRSRHRAEPAKKPKQKDKPKATEKAKAKRHRGQSFGQPWDGHLEGATRLRFADGVLIRRPLRAFGTRTTVEHLRRAVNDTLELFPRTHTLAIGDLSAREGGWLSEHHSHQSGRDADVGLFYKKRPPGYPQSFVAADEDNLDRAATWALIAKLVATADQDGGVHLIFLDHDIQGLIYEWALDHKISKRRLDRIFQYPHGFGASAGIVRHEPNHDNHMHVRFRCAAADVDCR